MIGAKKRNRAKGMLQMMGKNQGQGNVSISCHFRRISREILVACVVLFLGEGGKLLLKNWYELYGGTAHRLSFGVKEQDWSYEHGFAEAARSAQWYSTCLASMRISCNPTEGEN